MLDCIIKHTHILDGTGAPGRDADIGIVEGRISAVGRLDGDAERVIDCEGLVAAPGFIDIHSHTDSGLLVDPRAESKITQGITLEVCGNCGFSPAPCIDEASRTELESWCKKHAVEADWLTLGDWLDVLESKEIAVNVAVLVGHANVRSAVVGLANREPSPRELAEMKRLVSEAMEEGAFGLSSGLIYAPSCFADTAELAELASAAAPYGGFYASHIRSERDEMVAAVEEAIEVGRRAGVAVEIAHHKACGSNNWGKVATTLEMVEAARREGLDVTVDQYPYTAAATSLSILLPKWAHDGGRKCLLQRLDDRRNELLRHLQEAGSDGGSIANDGGWTTVLVSSVRSDQNRRYEGMNLVQIAQQRHASPEETALDLLKEEELAVSMVHFAQSEEDVRTVMKSPYAMLGTDASARSTTGELAKGKPHPRAFGTFPRVLGRYVNQAGVISLEAAIRKMTSMPAAKLGISDRGVIRAGNWADIVVFDPGRVIDLATYEDPHQISRGVEYVFVNGRLAVERGELTGTLAGRVLRRGRT